jgi:hypothetical protein
MSAGMRHDRQFSETTRFINLGVIVSLESYYTMMPNLTSKIRTLYFEQQSIKSSEIDSSDLDTKLGSHEGQSSSLSDIIFGNDMRQQQMGVKELNDLRYERLQLHKKHMGDLWHRHIQIQSAMYAVFIAKQPDRTKRLSSLETQLLQTENAQREEELAFWKDTSDLRQKLIEMVSLYNSSRQRYSLFSGVEAGYGGG